MKDLITEITADFEYNEGEYCFSTTFLGDEFEVQAYFEDGEVNNFMCSPYSRSPRKTIEGVERLIESLIKLYAHEGFIKKEEIKTNNKK